MSTSEIALNLRPPAELVAFVERQIRNARPYADSERRSDKRHLIAVPILVQQLDEQHNVVGDPVAAMTRDIAPKGIGLVYTSPFEQGPVALQMTLAGETVNLVVEIRWCRAFGPFYYFGGDFVAKLDKLPKPID